MTHRCRARIVTTTGSRPCGRRYRWPSIHGLHQLCFSHCDLLLRGRLIAFWHAEVA